MRMLRQHDVESIQEVIRRGYTLLDWIHQRETSSLKKRLSGGKNGAA